jgi:hypothetical protein
VSQEIKVSTAPLTSGERALLARYVREVGEARALTELALGRQTLARAIAGLSLRRGTIALVRARFGRMEGDAVTEYRGVCKWCGVAFHENDRGKECPRGPEGIGHKP